MHKTVEHQPSLIKDGMSDNLPMGITFFGRAGDASPEAAVDDAGVALKVAVRRVSPSLRDSYATRRVYLTLF